MRQDSLLPSESAYTWHRRYIGLLRQTQIVLKGMKFGVKLFLLLMLIGTAFSSIVMAEQLAKKVWDGISPDNSLVQTIEVYIVESFKDSQLLNHIEGISIVAAAVTFLKSGQAEQKLQTRYVALSTLDKAQDVPTSLARNLALEELVRNKEPLRGLDLPANADLKDISLRGACLPEATLNGVILEDADLSKAKLDQTALKKANLTGANLEGAYLVKSTLEEANLQSAKLMFANLRYAFLRKADFRCANLEGADFEGANVAMADFRLAKNLTVKQIQKAHNWQYALYDDQFLVGAQVINVALNPAEAINPPPEEEPVSEPDQQPILYLPIATSLYM